MKFYKTPTQKYRLYLIKKLLKNKKRGEFIEIGCGLGFITALLIKKGLKGKGIDPSKKSIGKARELHPQIKDCFTKQSITDLKEDKKYNLIIMAEVLEHLENDLEVLKKINNLLEQNGVFLLTAPAHKKAWTIKDEFAGHLRRYEKKDLTSKLKNAGFKIKKFYSFGFPLFNLTTEIALKKALKKNDFRKDLFKKNAQGRSLESGHTRIIENEIQKSSFLFNPVFIRPLFWFQNIFLKTDLGQNYIILSRKK